MPRLQTKEPSQARAPQSGFRANALRSQSEGQRQNPRPPLRKTTASGLVASRLESLCFFFPITYCVKMSWSWRGVAWAAFLAPSPWDARVCGLAAADGRLVCGACLLASASAGRPSALASCQVRNSDSPERQVLPLEDEGAQENAEDDAEEKIAVVVHGELEWACLLDTGCPETGGRRRRRRRQQDAAPREAALTSMRM